MLLKFSLYKFKHFFNTIIGNLNRFTFSAKTEGRK